jgi:HEAT repeat protein
VVLYDAVRASQAPSAYQIAATRGAILARGSGGIPFLIKLLKSDERETRNIALHTVREIRNSGLAEALRSELQTAKPEVQAQLIEALAEFRDSQSLSAIRSRTASHNAEGRRAALKVLGKAGDQTDAAVLLKAVQNTSDPAESAVAGESLAQLRGPQADSMILSALASSNSAAVRIALIDLIDARPPVVAATPELIKQAGDQDVKVSVAALRALRSLAGVQELPALIALTKTYQDGSQRAAVESTLYYASVRTGETAAAGELLLKELKQTTEDLDKASWIRTLCSIGYRESLPAVSASAKDRNSWLAGVAIESLAKWPGPEPVGDLLGLAESGTEPQQRSRALSAALQLVTASNDRKQLSADAAKVWFQRAGSIAQSVEEKRLIISVLSRWRTPASVESLLSYVEDPDVKAAAMTAILDIAQRMAALFEDLVSLKQAIGKLPVAVEPALRERTEIVRGMVAAAEISMKEGKQ